MCIPAPASDLCSLYSWSLLLNVWVARRSVEHMVCGSCGSVNEIINIALQRKLQKRSANRTCGVGMTDAGGPSTRLESIRFKTKRPELTRVGSSRQHQKVHEDISSASIADAGWERSVKSDFIHAC